MAAHIPDEDTPLSGPYRHLSSDATGFPPNIIPCPDDIQYPYHSSHVETLPPIHNEWYNANNLGGDYNFNASYDTYGIGIENEPGLSYGAPYAAAAYPAGWNFGPVPPTHMVTIPTAFYPTSASFSPVNDTVTYYDPPSYTYPPPGLPFASPSTPRQVEELSDPRATPSGHELLCLWGSPTCGQILADGSSATLRAHLRNAHAVDLGAGTQNTKRTSARCLWGEECSLKSEHILVSGMAKHIATCHLKSTSLSCASCGQVCSRQDALKRHVQLYCPASKQAEGYKPERRRSQGQGSPQRELGWD